MTLPMSLTKRERGFSELQPTKKAQSLSALRYSARCKKVPTIRRRRIQRPSDHCEVMCREQVSVAMGPILVTNDLSAHSELICIHSDSVRMLLYPSTSSRVTKTF
jgi:hypothetical protein